MANPTRRTVLALLPAALAAPSVLRAASPVQTLTGDAFGARWRVSLPDGARAGGLRARIAALLAQVDAQMSPWRADSEIGRLNASAEARRPVSVHTAQVSAAALRIAAQSGGHFDPTVGPLVARWGFGPITGATRPHGWQAVSVQGDEITRDAPLTLDLCGIAKGHALDRVAALLAADYGDFLIDVGGELTARGRHPSGRGWQIAVEDPRGPGVAEVLALDGRAVATSGDGVNVHVTGGRRLSHIIDPDAGAPVAGPLASVSVVAGDAMTADGWATALFAAGTKAGPALAQARGIAALFLWRDATPRRMTGGFERYLARA